jgi:hypothetical protein
VTTTESVPGNAHPSGATGYTLVLPPPWRQIPVRSGTPKAVRQISDEAFRHLPRHISRDKVTPYRIELERRLTSAADQARRHGGTDLYLPVDLAHGTLLAASFIASEGWLGTAGELRASDIVPRLAAGAAEGASSARVTVDDAAGVRTEHISPADSPAEPGRGSRRVDYVLPVPGAAGRWLVVAFSALGAGDPADKFADLLVELFDAIMSTFRWTRASTGQQISQ